MMNPFEQLSGRRNAGANFSTSPLSRLQNTARPQQAATNPFMAQTPQTPMQQSSVPTQQMAGPTQQTATRQRDRYGVPQQRYDGQRPGGADRFGAPAPVPAPAPQQPYGQNFSAQGGQPNPFMYNPQQRNQPHYGGQWWPGSGEMNLLQQGINPWGGQMNPDQQQWLQQVGPYLNIPQMTGSWDGRNELGRDFTAVNQADQAGGDVSRAFVNAWLGKNRPQVSQNIYNVRHQGEASGVGNAPGAPRFGPYRP